MTNHQLEIWRTAAETAAALGAAQLEQWRSRFSVREKARSDLVTEADMASQHAVLGYLKNAFPDHHFVGEEDANARDYKLAPDAPPTWVIDPLDGTANYVHDVPVYCVSIGLVVGGVPVVGVIHDPRMKEVFSCAKGLGATLNGSPIRVSDTATLEYALLSTGFPPDPTAQERNLRQWMKFSYSAQGLRRTGSTALNMAYVACGRYDGYWAYDNFAWDVAGGMALILEAGGAITCADGSPLDVFRHDVCAGNPAVHAQMLASLLS